MPRLIFAFFHRSAWCLWAVTQDGKDCFLIFVAHARGNACVQGHNGLVFEVLAPRFSSCMISDIVWQRVCWKLLENIPECWLESAHWACQRSRIMGNLVFKNKKAQFDITHKLLLLQYKYEVRR
ncbi:hypothetical protein J4Q44_G00237120 [Coregonus suidteri]|uniref:Secreted protein n=1 Tax=Coregonus suidteri TaxID=861788 RepID=A0AAN8QYY0_9TELE